ncbi:proton-coupled zinc antiporter SLC30A1-like [Heteronotia binoei]|uniref:proton-coupled zinc antiporter SLC30A1-like n=1 Tax=Heteronotia binoei TaxID=13085 RepID=UPI00292F7864|nr:proton-coupled zinc antiporter SLC30A1-like [Heteronotia binoei]
MKAEQSRSGSQDWKLGGQKRKEQMGFWTSMGSLWTGGSTGWPAGQFCLSISLFVVEVVASRATGSLLLLSCSFHTLAGALALGVALADVWLATEDRPSERNTFGWARARVAGTLVSTVFLSALSLTVLPEAFRRVADPQVTEHTLVLMGIGAVGIPIHLARTGLHEKQHVAPGPRPCCSGKATRTDSSAQETEDLLGNESSPKSLFWLEEPSDSNLASPTDKSGPWQALCFGWMVPCLGPAAVLLYSLTLHILWSPCLRHTSCFWHCTGRPCWAWPVSEPLPHTPVPCWLLYLDPGLAVVVAVALMLLLWPAFRGSALVLLQAVPEDLDLQLLELRLHATEGVAAVRELHVWQLDGLGSLVAMVEVSCFNTATFEAVMERVRQVFCEHGIHMATVQPELGTCQGRECHRGGSPAPHNGYLAPSPKLMMEYETTV